MTEYEFSPERQQRSSREQVEALLDNKEALFTILDRKARRMARDTAEYKLNGEQSPEAYRLDKAHFDRLYDKELPTLVIDLCCSYRNSELTGQAAQIIRDRVGESINIVYARPDTDSVSLVVAEDDEGVKGAVRVTHGILIDADGNTYAGELPEAVHSDTIETNNMLFLEQCEELGIETLNRPDSFRMYEYKEDLSLLAAEAGIQSPLRLDRLPEFYNHQFRTMVTKPRNESGGAKGVRVYNTYVSFLESMRIAVGKENYPESSTRYSQSLFSGAFGSNVEGYWYFLKAGGYEPYQEQYIESFPLYDSHGNKVSWSVRHNIGANELLGTYIRINTTWEPTNQSHGSQNISLEEFRDMLEDKERADMIINQIIHDGNKLARVIEGGIAGVDVIIGEDAKSYLIEVNLGQVGGLNRQTALAPPGQKIEPHERFINAIRKKCRTFTKPEAFLYQERVKRNIITLFKGSYDTDNIAAFANLTKEDVTRDPVGRHFAGWLWIWARLHIHNQQQGSGEELRLIIDDALEVTPMTFLEKLAPIIENYHNPKHFENLLEELAMTFHEFLPLLQYVANIEKNLE